MLCIDHSITAFRQHSWSRWVLAYLHNEDTFQWSSIASAWKWEEKKCLHFQLLHPMARQQTHQKFGVAFTISQSGGIVSPKKRQEHCTKAKHSSVELHSHVWSSTSCVTKVFNFLYLQIHCLHTITILLCESLTYMKTIPEPDPFRRSDRQIMMGWKL